METILLLAHTEADGSLAKSAREALHAAATLHKSLAGSKLVVGLVGESVQAAANSIASCPATKYFGVVGKDFSQSRYATDAAAAEDDLQSGPSHARRRPGNFAVEPCVARCRTTSRRTRRHARHRRQLSAGDKVTINRWYYRQRMEAALQRTQRPWFILIDPGSQSACECGAGTVTVENVAVALPESARRTTVTGFRAPAADAQTIRPDAQLLFVTGAGWTKKQADGQTHVPEAEKLIRGFLQLSARVAGQQQIAGGPKRRRPGRPVIPLASQPDWPDRRDAAASERIEHLLSRRGAAHGGLAFHRRAPRDQSRSELRLGARQGGRAICRRRVCRDGKSEGNADHCGQNVTSFELELRFNHPRFGPHPR